MDVFRYIFINFSIESKRYRLCERNSLPLSPPSAPKIQGFGWLCDIVLKLILNYFPQRTRFLIPTSVRGRKYKINERSKTYSSRLNMIKLFFSCCRIAYAEFHLRL